MKQYLLAVALVVFAFTVNPTMVSAQAAPPADAATSGQATGGQAGTTEGQAGGAQAGTTEGQAGGAQAGTDADKDQKPAVP